MPRRNREGAEILLHSCLSTRCVCYGGIDRE